MSRVHEELCQDAKAAIDAVADDETVSPAEAVEFLAELAYRINMLIQALKMMKSWGRSDGAEARIGPRRESLDESERAEGWDAGDLTVNALYDVEHKYKDDFQMQVWDADGPWIYGALVAGNLKDWRRVGIAFGDRIAVRRSYCTFTLAAGSEAPAVDRKK